MNYKRIPTMNDSLEAIKNFSISISCVVDIGVFHETAQLKKNSQV